MKKTLIAFLLVAAMLFTFCGCKKIEYKIDFIVDGEVYGEISTSGKETLKMPDDPTKDGFTFDGWYWDKDVWQKQFTADSLSDEALTCNVTVYAKWTEKPYAKVIILSGQSNMFGSGAIADITPQSVGQARYDKLSNPINNVRILMNEGDSLDDFKPIRLGVGHVWDTNFGPELGLAEYFSDRVADGETVFVIKYALSGTRLYDTWVSPSRTDFEVTNAYKSLTALIDNGLQILEKGGFKPQILGFCWMQGESDSVLQEAIDTYRVNQFALAKDLRERYDEYSFGGRMNFVDAMIGQSWTFGGFINLAKMQFRDGEPEHNVLLDTQAPDLVKQGVDGLTFLDDGIHYDAISVLKLGQMFAEKISQLTK